MKKIGLVLEGGGMRGMFTAGVLDFFLEQNIEFGEIIGVSAGVIHALNFISKQKQRSRDITLKYINDKRYCSWRSLLTTGDMFNVKFSYEEIPQRLNKFDQIAFKNNKTKLLVVISDVKKGKPKYVEINNFDHDEILAVRASASLPMISNIVKYRGKEYLDGGLTDAIPLKRIEADGFKKNVVILTQAASYRKRKSRSYLAMRAKYRNYPALIRNVKNRHNQYNESLDYLAEREKTGDAFIIRPDGQIKIKRIEKNLSKLEAAYNNGYETAKRIHHDLVEFIGK